MKLVCCRALLQTTRPQHLFPLGPTLQNAVSHCPSNRQSLFRIGLPLLACLDSRTLSGQNPGLTSGPTSRLALWLATWPAPSQSSWPASSPATWTASCLTGLLKGRLHRRLFQLIRWLFNRRIGWLLDRLVPGLWLTFCPVSWPFLPRYVLSIAPHLASPGLLGCMSLTPPQWTFGLLCKAKILTTKRQKWAPQICLLKHEIALFMVCPKSFCGNVPPHAPHPCFPISYSLLGMTTKRWSAPYITSQELENKRRKCMRGTNVIRISEIHFKAEINK